MSDLINSSLDIPLQGFAYLDTLINNRFYLALILLGLLLIFTGMYISVYKKSVNINYKKLKSIKTGKYIKILVTLIQKLPLKILYSKLEKSLSCFMLKETAQQKLVIILTFLLPGLGILMYIPLNSITNLWYTKASIFLLCLMVPYYIFTLAADYMKYSLRQKIPVLIDSFRSSFMLHNRIKPALLDCSKNLDRSMGRIISRASDCSDLNESLYRIRDRINDTWFNIFVLLLVNYRENGGELMAQLYKLNRTITRYNNIEKKKNKRLIWYEVFTVAASILSIPAVLIINKLILGVNAGVFHNATISLAKLAAFSLSALLVVRILRRL